MAQTIKVPSAEGEVDLQVLTVEEIDSLLNDNNPQSRKQIMEHMKLLGRPVTELIKMKVPERKAFILERYAELGVGGAKPKAKGGTVTQIGKGAAAKAAAPAAAATKVKAKAAAPEPPPEEEEEEEEAAASGSESMELAALREIIEAQTATIEDLASKVEASDEKLDKVLEALGEQMKVLLDAHFIIRSTAPTAAGLSEDDVVEYGNAQGYYGTLLVDEEQNGAAAGNG